jgi:hypothetical protein
MEVPNSIDLNKLNPNSYLYLNFDFDNCKNCGVFGYLVKNTFEI